ncbi:MAG: LamG domain-containing protein [Verrucomicrobium sp.]|nr:LamG domain-containing protein [Verrucomicrobium sp.]
MKTPILPSRWGIAAACLAALPQLAQASDYANSVVSAGPAAYYRLGDSTARGTNHLNSGLAAGVVAAQNLGRVHTMPGAIAGDSGRAAFFDFTSRTEIPWNAAVNPKNDKPFTIEAWFYPTSDQTANGQCPINNRFAYSGVDRQGWVFFQRKPDASYAGSEGVGWNFRMFRGAGSSSGLDVLSGVPYLIGKWTHVVVVYDPKNVVDATVTMYIDGKEAVTKAWTGGSDGTQPGYVANSNDHDPSVAVFRQLQQHGRHQPQSVLRRRGRVRVLPGETERRQDPRPLPECHQRQPDSLLLEPGEGRPTVGVPDLGRGGPGSGHRRELR